MYISFVGMAALMLMMIITTADVVGRNFFSWPVPGAYELTVYMLTLTVLLSIAYAQQIGQNVNVDFFVVKLPKSIQIIIDIVFTIIAIAIFIIDGMGHNKPTRN